MGLAGRQRGARGGMEGRIVVGMQNKIKKNKYIHIEKELETAEQKIF